MVHEYPNDHDQTHYQSRFYTNPHYQERDPREWDHQQGEQQGRVSERSRPQYGNGDVYVARQSDFTDGHHSRQYGQHSDYDNPARSGRFQGESEGRFNYSAGKPSYSSADSYGWDPAGPESGPPVPTIWHYPHYGVSFPAWTHRHNEGHSRGQYGVPGRWGSSQGFLTDPYNNGFRRNQNERGLMDRASDEVRSWLGDEEAQWRRKHIDHRGKGPQGYKRSDNRIEEDVSDRLTDDSYLDASEIDISVKDGEVTLDGTVDSKFCKRRAEDCADSISGVGHVQNNLRVKQKDSVFAANPSMSSGENGDFGSAKAGSGRDAS